MRRSLPVVIALVAGLFVGSVPAAFASTPLVVGTQPIAGSTNVPTSTSVTVDVFLPNEGAGVDASTLTENTLYLYETGQDPVATRVPATRGTSGGSDTITLDPIDLLDRSTSYTFVVDGVADESGAVFQYFEMSFTTAADDPPVYSGDISFTKSTQTTAGLPYASLAIGPDGRLYASTLIGDFVTWDINPDGSLANETIVSLPELNNRAVIGLAFDPASTASDITLWISHNNGDLSGTSLYPFSGAIARVTLTDAGGPGEAWSIEDVIVGLPRSLKDHLTNSLAFGPDGAIYIQQGGISAMGAPDNAWGLQPENLLSAATLRLDPALLPGTLPVDVTTGVPLPDGDMAGQPNYGLGDPELASFYDPQAPGAPLTIYASGVRNAYDLVWHTNGELYVPGNGSSFGGNTPGTPGTLPNACDHRIDGPYTGGSVPALTAVATQPDLLFRVEEGGYYGHPNPTRCEWVLNGGNPTSATDPVEVVEYSVGQAPDQNWRGGAFDFGDKISPNGAIEYRSNTFGGTMRGMLLVTRYSAGNDIIVLEPGGPNLDIVDSTLDIPGLDMFDGVAQGGPLDIAEDLTTGNLYVAELNEIGGASLIHLLTPDEPGLPEVTVSPQIVSLEAVNGATSPAQTVTVTNTGTEPLTITGVALGGPSGDDFNFSGPGLPLTLDPQQATTIDVTYDAPNGFEGVGQGRLFVQTNDPLNPTGTAYLFGLSKDGFGGGAEPSLQYVFDSLGLGLDVGDNNPNTPIINSSTPFAEPLGPDELTVEIFTKADSGPVIVEPLAAYAPDANPDEVGWHIASDDTTRTPLFGVPAGGSQQLAPPATGDLLFNPGGEDFGFYSQWPFFSDRLVYTEDLLNTWDSQRHHARIYPYRLLNGEVIDNWYIVAIEEHDSGWDYQDIVLLVKNVEPADARVRFENRDWQTLNSLDVAGMEWVNTWLTFNTITNPVGTRPFHDEVTLRIHNDHPSTPLDITGLTFSDPTTYLFPNGEDAALPVTIPGGGFYDLLVKFDRDTGVRGAYIDSLTIETTDPNQPTSLINLGGGWQEAPEGDFEYHMREIVKAFGYTTNIDDNDGDGEQGDGIPPGTWEPAGEEVLSRFWRIANPDEPMYVRQLAAFHGSSGETAIFAFDDGENRFLFHDSDWYQSLLPLNNNIGDPGDIGPAEITELGNTSDFEAVVSGNRACDAPCTTHGIRWWPVRDPSGKVVPDVFVFTMDYVGGGGANFDYNDNAYLVTNVEPVSTNTDISMALGYSPAAPFFGDAVTVTATVTNETVVNAIDVAISELDIDGSFSVQSVTPSQGTCDDAFIPITCDLGNIAGGDSVTVEVVLTSGQEGTIDVQATATSLGEVNLNNNTAQLSYYVLGQIAPRITILKDAQPDGAQSFAFTGGLGAFSLTDNGGTQPNTFFVQYNFQPSAPPPPPGFAVDDGSAYGPRDNGETYGWFKASDGLPIDAAGATRERNRDGIAPELDTIIHMRRGDCCSGGFTEEIVWEHDLPNGFYEVTVSVGDEPDFGGTYNADHVVNAEGQNVVTFLDPSEQQEYATGTLIVEVTDGRLTLDSVGGFNTKINYVTIQGVSLPDNQAAFLGLTPGTYTITESDTPGWSLDDIACTGGTFTYLPDGVEVTVDFADRVTCTFTNSEIPTSFTLLNPSFEQELSGNWALNSQGDGDTRFAYAGAQSGSHVMLFTASGSTEFIRQTVPVTGGFSGDSYTLSFYIGGQNLGTGGAVGARLEFLNGGDVVNRINCTAANRGTFNWQLITCPTAAAAGAYDAIRITLGTQGIAEGLLGFDSVVLSLD